MLKYKNLLVAALAFTTLFNAALFYTNEVTAQPGNNSVILGSKKLRPKTAPEMKPRFNNFWGCLNLNSGGLPLLRIFRPTTPFPIKPKPKCKEFAWACPILSPQGNTNASERNRSTSKIRLMQPKPECKDNVWECLILEPLSDMSSSEN